MQMTRSLKRRIIDILLGLLAALVVIVLILNAMPQEKQLTKPMQGVSAVTSDRFRIEASSLLGPTVLDGNQVEDLQNGDEIFPAMLKAIREARASVNLEMYIYSSGELSKRFVAALTERARAGVAVHVLIDWVGASELEDSVVQDLRAAGVQFEYFHPLRWYTINRLNNRTHRKLLIVDGRIGFAGGADIADAWDGNATRPDQWRDMMFRVTGPIVAQIQAIFEDNWITTTGKVLLGPEYYPVLQPSGTSAMQMFASSPDGGSMKMQLMYLMAINGARASIDLEAAYFIPDELTMQALESALKRGVKIRIVVPGPHAESLPRAASQAQWGAMLRGGGHIYRYQPSLFHSKMMIVDRYLTIVGSANFDNRSFELNDEANLNIYDHAFGEHMTDVVDGDIARSKQVSLAEWQHRPWHQKLMDWLASLADSQL